MRRAIELARRGAGLVSPNPLVGAVLVNDGRVVGEGYHLYDRLKHAERYAIEAAGTLARGATLYCNLEPCCHHGRTAPCAAALIEAGIARAVIAVKDPDSRVSGMGIEQLRGAGIEVEVGLLEERAIRINESYFKFVITGKPFVHGVIEYPTEATDGRFDWLPSNKFLQAASEYDALMIGDRPEINKLVVEEALNRERHRTLVVAASTQKLELVEGLRKRIRKQVSVVRFEEHAPPADITGRVVRLDEGISRGGVRSQIASLLATLARMNVTSLLTLPARLDLSDPANFEELDKVTLVVPGASNDQRLSGPWTFGDAEFDVEEVSVSEAGGYTELTGYPSLRGVA